MTRAGGTALFMAPENKIASQTSGKNKIKVTPKKRQEDLQDKEFQYEELKLQYEEQEERTEKFSVMAREKLKPFKMIKMIWMKPKPNLKLKSIRLWQREMNVFREGAATRSLQ